MGVLVASATEIARCVIHGQLVYGVDEASVSVAWIQSRLHHRPDKACGGADVYGAKIAATDLLAGGLRLERSVLLFDEGDELALACAPCSSVALHVSAGALIWR